MTRASGEGPPAGRLFAPTDGASLAFFRIAFGSILLWEVVRFFRHGWITEYFLDPPFHFTYAGFRWVRPWPGWGMHAHFAVLGVLALGLVLGWRQRLCAGLYCAGFAYVFLLEKARYLNHFYLVILLTGLLAIVPADRTWSWAARRRGRALPAPAWGLFLLRTQLGLVYLLAAVAKLNVDWMSGHPLSDWLPARGDHPLLGPLLVHEAAPLFFAWSGFAIDLLAWPLLSWRPTREPMFIVVCLFHLTNASLFGIGIFPWAMIASTTLFFEPDWPRRLLGRIGRATSSLAPGDPTSALGYAPTPVGAARRAADGAPAGTSRDGSSTSGDHDALPPTDTAPGRRRLVVGFLVVHLTFQALFPLRHFLYPGNVSWTEEGHAFAWHMKLRGKDGEIAFHVVSPTTGEQWIVDPRVELVDWQVRKMSGRPDMILQYAHHLAEEMVWEADGPVEVHAVANVSLNGRPAQLLVDPEVDLAQETWGIAPSSWIVPLEETER